MPTRNKKIIPHRKKIIISDSDSSDSDKSELIEEMKSHALLKKYNKKSTNTSMDSDSDSESSFDSDESSNGSENGKSEIILEKNTIDDMMESSKDINKVKKLKKNSNEIFKELIKKQLSDIPQLWKLNINDMKRICKYIDNSIFDNDSCCIWNGYITNMNNSNKGTYVNFYFRNKKVALHRLLYSNFVAPLDSSEYLKFNCENKGICCNINHYEKYKYSKNNGISKKEQKKKEPKKEIKEICIIGNNDGFGKLIINFDE